jgi:hypothetical protein
LTVLFALTLLLLLLLMWGAWSLLAGSKAVCNMRLLQLLQLLPAGAAAVVEGLVAPWRGIILLWLQQWQQRQLLEQLSVHCVRHQRFSPGDHLMTYIAVFATNATAANTLTSYFSDHAVASKCPYN